MSEDREDLKRFNIWRRRVTKGLPALCGRVFALRTAFYEGCGFHWSLEKQLGKVIAMANDFDNRFGLAERIIAQVQVEGLFQDLKKAERSARQYEKAK